MLNNYLNKLHAATGHFSCSRGLSQSQMPQFTQTPSPASPPCQGSRNTKTQLGIYASMSGTGEGGTGPWWDQHQQQVPFTASGTWLHVWHPYKSPLPWSPCPLLRVHAHGCRPKHSTVHQFEITKYLSGPDFYISTRW